jgi:hypothetical protein
MARYTVMGKFPQALGQLKYWFNRIFGRTSRIIEHKPIAIGGKGPRDGPCGNACSGQITNNK